MLEFRVKAVRELAPGATWEFRSADGNYEDLFWMDDNITKPTEEEFNAKVTEIETNAPLNEVRLERNRRLTESDWTQMADSSLTDSVKAEWVTYRTALKDITDSATSLDDVTWPTKPS